ncbi:tetratricopeptide repeat protein [uncultured Alsobacter sp.]|uniref:tetratricopeptide repeat protein n=1 Tax=uncultured Alsobacter sp. TaxID=1748258 RepID=UPI0025FDF85E|nr:tetratricopeptide repeat protein [uncultured Alsobacter sp.]
MQDRYNGRHGIDDTDAIAAYERAVAALAGHRPSAGAALDEAITRAPDFVAGHALKGFALLTLGREEMRPGAIQAAAKARSAARRSARLTESESVLVDALDLAVAGRFLDASAHLEARLREEPLNFLLLKLAHALRFMAGDTPGMLAATSSVIHAWRSDEDASGYVFGCHAFALEEAGRYAEAERFGEVALALAPDDAWGLHALSHVDEMNRRVAIGIRRLESTRDVWSRCNNFQFHMAWHLALMCLESGDAERALALYDEDIRPQPTDDYRDVANAASLLWRLRLAGVSVGDRWEELAVLARRRAAETTLMFASLHHMLSLAATGDTQGLDAALAAWEAHAASGTGDQACVAASVGLDLARVVAGRRTDFARVMGRLPAIGGSAAQRDVFVQTLVHAARSAGDGEAVRSILALRRRQRGEDAFGNRMASLEAA